MVDEMMTTRQAAQQLQLHPQTVRRWLHTGKLSGRRLGSTRAGWRIPQTEVQRVLMEGVEVNQR
jgi:excisionase family DNA binding protein